MRYRENKAKKVHQRLRPIRRIKYHPLMKRISTLLLCLVMAAGLSNCNLFDAMRGNNDSDLSETSEKEDTKEFERLLDQTKTKKIDSVGLVRMNTIFTKLTKKYPSKLPLGGDTLRRIFLQDPSKNQNLKGYTAGYNYYDSDSERYWPIGSDYKKIERRSYYSVGKVWEPKNKVGERAIIIRDVGGFPSWLYKIQIAEKHIYNKRDDSEENRFKDHTWFEYIGGLDEKETAVGGRYLCYWNDRLLIVIMNDQKLGSAEKDMQWTEQVIDWQWLAKIK